MGRGFLETVGRTVMPTSSFSEGEDSLCSLPSWLARGDEVSKREVRSEIVFRSRYDTKIGGGSSPSVLPVLEVFIEELEILGDREALFLEEVEVV